MMFKGKMFTYRFGGLFVYLFVSLFWEIRSKGSDFFIQDIYEGTCLSK